MLNNKNMKKTGCILLVFATILLAGCGKQVQEFGSYWGKQTSFKNFLWYKYTPDTITQTLYFNVGEESFTKPLVLGLFETNVNYETGEETVNIVGDEVELFVNGKLSEDKKFKVLPSDKELTLGVVFSNGAKEGDYYWNLVVIDAGDLDMINDYLTTTKIPILVSWKADYATKMNPLAVILLLLCAVIVVLLVLWLAVLQWIIFRRFRFSDLQIVYMDDGSRKGMQTISLSGARKVILSAQYQSQSIINRIFTGRIEFIENKFWTDKVEINPVDSQSVTFDKGASTLYRTKSAMILMKNNARNPFVVQKSNATMQANISIS